MALTIYREIKLLKDEVKTLPDSELRKEVLDSIIEFIKTSGFYKSRNFDDFIKYMELPDKKIATLMGVRETWVRTMKSRSTKAFFEIFPSDVFTIIRDGDEKELSHLLKVVDLLSLSLKSSEIIPENILDETGYLDDGRLPKKKEFSSFDISDCNAEIKFLRQHSLTQVRQQLRNLDVEKIKFLLRLIDGNESSSRYVERAKIIDYLTIVVDNKKQGTSKEE